MYTQNWTDTTQRKTNCEHTMGQRGTIAHWTEGKPLQGYFK
jgi:hypothetical protein